MTFMPKRLHHNYKHGHRLSKNTSGTYKTWASMRNRCNPANADRHPAYAGSGITLCNRWAESFEAFLEDMGERPDGCTIDRINPMGNYEPGNCRWADSKTQALNRMNTVIVEIRGEELCLRDVSKKYGIPNTTINRRYRQGIRGEELIEKKNRNTYRIGAKTASAKLDDDKVREIKKLLAAGCKNVDIARQFSVSGAVISEIKHGKLWAHVKS